MINTLQRLPMHIRLISNHSFSIHWDRCLGIFRPLILILKYIFGLFCVTTHIVRVINNFFISHLTHIDTVDIIIIAARVTGVSSTLYHRHTNTLLFYGISILLIVAINSWNHLFLSITGKHEFSCHFLLFTDNLICCSFFELLHPICIS
jgi:hypothetical protein